MSDEIDALRLEIARDEHIAAARQLGQEHAESAATWAADGNTSKQHARHVLDLMADGDPYVEELLPARPDLSGEWSDGMTPRALYVEVVGDDPDDDFDIDALANAYDDAVSEHFEQACARALLAILPDDERMQREAEDEPAKTCAHCGREILPVEDGAWRHDGFDGHDFDADHTAKPDETQEA